MITTAEEYQKYLWRLQDQNRPVSAILLPSDENVYEIDLNTRTISAPEFLSVKKDHAAETIYFLIDRFYDNMDLTTTCCVVQYKNVKTGKERFFPVPFYDVTTFSNAVSDEFIRAIVEEKNYKINTYYIQDENYNYILTSEEFNPLQSYYIKNTPNLNQKYIKVNLTQEKYTPGNFYCIETNKENPAFGQYVQSFDEFDSQKNYFAKIDRRYMPIAVTNSSYKKDCYFIINAEGNMEISSDGYNNQESYYIFIDSQKILFPWVISSDVTEAEGIVEFSVRFYQMNSIQGSQIGTTEEGVPIYNYSYQYTYNLNTKPAKSQVIYGMSDIIEQEGNAIDQSALAYVLSELNKLSNEYQLYWIEA